MAIFLYPLLLLVTGCGGAVLATVNKDGKEYTTDIITAQSNKHRTSEEAKADIRHAADVYCQNRGGGYDLVGGGPTWDPVTSTPVTRYNKCTSVYERGINSCDRYTVNDGYILKDEKNNGCWVMYDCKEVVKTHQFSDISGSQQFRCFKK